MLGAAVFKCRKSGVSGSFRALSGYVIAGSPETFCMLAAAILGQHLTFERVASKTLQVVGLGSH